MLHPVHVNRDRHMFFFVENGHIMYIYIFCYQRLCVNMMHQMNILSYDSLWMGERERDERVCVKR